MSSASRLAVSRPARLRARSAAQWFCLVVGVLLALRGAQQLLGGAGFGTPGEGWRATQQLLTSLLLLLGQRTERGARLVLIPFALFYVVLALVGDINGHEAFGLLPVDARDKVIHPLYAVLALLILAAGWQRGRRERRPRSVT
ncbi:MAG TPA: DUF4383 domain-containing protein [Solirubrobacteraceae bacterium]|jgi:hypothetical protein|nr:DUF4383 domain-containing protein [Solirubrobacteraceae bacterium]